MITKSVTNTYNDDKNMNLYTFQNQILSKFNFLLQLNYCKEKYIKFIKNSIKKQTKDQIKDKIIKFSLFHLISFKDNIHSRDVKILRNTNS